MYLLSVIFGMLLGVGCAVFIQRKKKSKDISSYAAASNFKGAASDV